MERRCRVSTTSALRIWKAHGPAPHRRATYKQPTDPRTAEILQSLGQLYQNPPPNLVVLCMNEQSQIPAREHTQLRVPVRPSHQATHTHDHVRHGLTNLFLAMRVRDGHVVHADVGPAGCAEPAGAAERGGRCEAPELQIHLILDNLSTHTAKIVQDWQDAHPRWTFHFTAKYASWINGAESTIAHVRQNCHAGYSARSVAELNQHTLAYIERYNRLWKKSFVWCRDPEEIIWAMRRGYMKSGMPCHGKHRGRSAT